MTLINGWTRYTGISYAKYRRLNGIVYIQGLVVGSSASSPIFCNLPVGFRPAIRAFFIGDKDDSAIYVMGDALDNGNLSWETASYGGLDYIWMHGSWIAG